MELQGNTAVNNQYGFWQSAHPYRADPAEPSKQLNRPKIGYLTAKY